MLLVGLGCYNWPTLTRKLLRKLRYLKRSIKFKFIGSTFFVLNFSFSMKDLSFIPRIIITNSNLFELK